MHHTMLGYEAVGLVDRRQGGLEPLDVVGVHAREEGVGMGRDLAGPVTEDAELLVRPDRAPAVQIVLPATDAGDALGFHKAARSEEHTSELQSLMRISYAV